LRRSRSLFGITLLELLAALAIVAILALMATASFARAVERARVREAKGVLQVIFNAERMYRLDTGAYGSLDNLVNGRYLANPNPHPDWGFGVALGGGGFTATATRSAGGYAGRTVTIDQNGVIGGSHELR
jgi:prepilin-type N-terminal cleavage/methylation domain-containing protein